MSTASYQKCKSNAWTRRPPPFLGGGLFRIKTYPGIGAMQEVAYREKERRKDKCDADL